MAVDQKKSNLKTPTRFHILGIFLMLAALFVLIYLVYSPKLPVFTDETIDLDPFRSHFQYFVTKYNKKYDNKDEYEQRFINYKETLKEIEILNERLYDTAEYGTNKFADMTQKEFEDTMLMDIIMGDCVSMESPCYHDDSLNESGQNGTLPPKFDWRDTNEVGPVLDQGNCLSCWAFSIVGVMESMLLISKHVKKYSRLSIQELTDCTVDYTFQCAGGNPESALKFLCDTDYYITSEKKYPLTLVNQTCREKPKTGVTITDFVVKCNMSALDIAKQVKSHGPVVAVVNSTPWKNYIGRVIRFHCNDSWDQINHVVQIVGYDMEDPVPHFILRNSWGSDFGDNGYVKVAMDGFVCGIGRQISYFNVKKIGK